MCQLIEADQETGWRQEVNLCMVKKKITKFKSFTGHFLTENLLAICREAGRVCTHPLESRITQQQQRSRMAALWQGQGTTTA